MIESLEFQRSETDASESLGTSENQDEGKARKKKKSVEWIYSSDHTQQSDDLKNSIHETDSGQLWEPDLWTMARDKWIQGL